VLFKEGLPVHVLASSYCIKDKKNAHKNKGTKEAKSKLNQLGLTGTSNLPAIDILRKTKYLMARVNQHPPAHFEGWMVSGQETVFCWVSVQLTMVVTLVAFFLNYLFTNKPTSRLLLGRK
jgi:hypothetical protein